VATYLTERGPFAGTIGFLAKFETAAVFVVSSHLTDRIAYDDDNQFGQPYDVENETSPYWIGREFRDPSFYQNAYYPLNSPFISGESSCNSGVPDAEGWFCRRSDAALILLGGALSFANWGYIARTSQDAYGPDASGPIDIAGKFRITGEAGSPSEGLMIDKVGRVTGWTWGYVTDKICIDVPRRVAERHPNDPNPEKLAFRCQHHITAGAQMGDSGAPVFKWNFDDTVILHGIVRGRSEYGVNYSSMDMIRLDLGLPYTDRTRLDVSPFF
jgi:hypothetical protein